MKVFLSLVLGAALQLLQAQEGPPPVHTLRERTFHILHYKLVLSVDVKGKSCTGDAFITLVPLRPQLDTVRLDAAGLAIGRTKLNNAFLSTSQTGETLAVALDKPYGLGDTLTIDIGYSVSSPQKGMYFIPADSGYPGRQWQAWTQGEGTDNHYWFPCYDAPNDLASSEVVVTVDDNLTVVSNGRLLSRQHDARRHTATFHWLEPKPHVSYLVSLAIGTYTAVPDSLGALPIVHYVYPSQVSDAFRSFEQTPAMIDYYSKVTGVPFPWEKYGHAVIEDFMFGGEENVSVSTLTDRTIHDARADLDYSSVPLVAHELAHQWYGDLISFRDWSHAWLSEGFATWFEMLYREHRLGKDAADKDRYDAQMLVVNTDRQINRRPTVCNRYNAVMDLFDSRIYQKGGAVLHMLRRYLGDELFFRALQHYTRKFAFHNAETNDLKVAFEETTGYTLDWFFDQWIYHAGYPEFQVIAGWSPSASMEEITVRQVQSIDSLTPLFRVPVDIQVWVHDAPTTYHVTIDQKEQSFRFPAYQEPQLVVFDKGSQVLKKILYARSLQEVLYQTVHAEDAIDRMTAIDELQWMLDSADVRSALERVAIEDPVGYVRRAAVWALGDVRKVDESPTLLGAYGDRESVVRTASVTSLARYRGEKVVALLQHAFRKDSSYTVAAAALRSLTLADSAHRQEYLDEALKRDSYNEALRSAALQRMAEIGDSVALRNLITYSRYGNDRNLRIQSIRSLLHGWNAQDDIVELVSRYLADPSYFVRKATLEALGDLDRDIVLTELDRYVPTERDPRLVTTARDARKRVEESIKNKKAH